MRLTIGLASLVMALAAPLAHAGGFLKDVERNVRKTFVKPVGSLVQNVVKTQSTVEIAAKTNDPKLLAEAQQRLSEAEAALDAEERRIRIEVEQKAVQKLLSDFSRSLPVQRRIDRHTLSAVMNALYERGFTLQPAVYDNYLFVEAEPRTIDDSGLTEVQVHLVFYWPRQGNVVNVRYSPLERRLRSPAPRPSKDPDIIKVADAYVAEIAKLLTAENKQ